MTEEQDNQIPLEDFEGTISETKKGIRLTRKGLDVFMEEVRKMLKDGSMKTDMGVLCGAVYFTARATLDYRDQLDKLNMTEDDYEAITEIINTLQKVRDEKYPDRPGDTTVDDILGNSDV